MGNLPCKRQLRKNTEQNRLNQEDRIWFVKYWAEYVRTHPDKDWSKQQKELIDAQFER